MGLCGPALRLPLTPLSASQHPVVEAALKAMAPPGATLRVDGFSGGQFSIRTRPGTNFIGNAVATIVRFMMVSPVFGLSQLFFFEYSNFGAFFSVSLSVLAWTAHLPSLLPMARVEGSSTT